MNSLRRQQRGSSLIEALIAFLVFSVGILTLARVQTMLRDSADIARQRSEAVRLAQQDLERLRGFVSVPSATSAPSYNEIEDESADVTPTGSNTRYTLTRAVLTRAEPRYKTIQVTLSWSDRKGGSQSVQLNSLIAAHDPAYSGALALSRP